jgi:hypothetical protein
MSNQNRFQFPGFTLTETQDTPNHEVEVGRVEDGGRTFILTLIRNKAFLHLPFVVAQATDAKETFHWSFQQEHFQGVGVLAKADDQVVIALTGKGANGKVERVIPLTWLADRKPLGLKAKLALKHAAGKFLGKEVLVADVEKTIVTQAELRAREQARREAAEAHLARQAAYEAREAARKERAKRILARDGIVTFTATGEERFGTPVVNSEWHGLPDGTKVILVESFDMDSETAGTPIEAFQIIKPPSRNATKGSRIAVSASKPLVREPGVHGVRPIRTELVEMDDDAFEVALYGSMDAIRAARAGGLNSGSYVAVMPTPGTKELMVYAVHHDHIDTVGKFQHLS